MAQRTWMLGLWLGLVGFSIATGCVVKSDDDDTDDGAAAAGGEDPGGGGTSGSASGGRGGSGGATGGTGGATGGTGGATGGTGGATGGTSGTGGDDWECDPGPNDPPLGSTPSLDCEPRTAGEDCEVCLQGPCCEEVRLCFAFDPGNVCGWGTVPMSENAEFDCFRFCAEQYVMDNGDYDDGVYDVCNPACTAQGCGLIGNATQDLVVCAETNCMAECFEPEM